MSRSTLRARVALAARRVGPFPGPPSAQSDRASTKSVNGLGFTSRWFLSAKSSFASIPALRLATMGFRFPPRPEGRFGRARPGVSPTSQRRLLITATCPLVVGIGSLTDFRRLPRPSPSTSRLQSTKRRVASARCYSCFCSLPSSGFNPPLGPGAHFPRLGCPRLSAHGVTSLGLRKRWLREAVCSVLRGSASGVTVSGSAHPLGVLEPSNY